MKPIHHKIASDFVLKHHYSNRKPQITCAFGYYIGEELVAVCTFGKPASNSLCEGVCGVGFKACVYELNRLCATPDLDIPLSKFVAYCLKELKKLTWIIVSYADTEMNHVGAIYQATNWIYTGLTKARTDKYTEGGKHPRHYDNSKQGNLRKVRSAKHRYIYFCGNKTVKSHFKKALKYPVVDYPKEDIKRYEEGFKLQPKIIKANETTSTK